MPTLNDQVTITTIGIERSTAEGYDWTFRRVMKWLDYTGDKHELVLRRHTYKNVHAPSMQRFFSLARKTYGHPSMDIISTKTISRVQWVSLLNKNGASAV